MTMSETNALSELLERAKTLSPEVRLTLARRILETLEMPPRPSSKRGRLVQELIGLGAGDGPPPDDEMVRHWIEELRLEKYG